MAETTRRHSFAKVRAGDYLLVSNDLRTLWRLRRYEDGPSHGVDGIDRDRTFWGAWKLRQPLARGVTINLSSDDDWSLEAEHFETRQAAVDWALQQEEVRAAA